VAKTSGILGVDHIAVFTPRLEEAERHYAALFGAAVLFRGLTHQGSWVSVDGDASWDDVRRRGLRLESTFLRAGSVTIIVSDEPAPSKDGPLNHVGIGTSDGEFKRIRDQVRALGLREHEGGSDTFKFRDRFGVLWEVSRGMEAAHRPPKRLDLGSGRVE
jgi:catechol 2,3-dioxygenase-like lactoylglutathione lyase family enzyme